MMLAYSVSVGKYLFRFVSGNCACIRYIEHINNNTDVYSKLMCCLLNIHSPTSLPAESSLSR